MKELGKILTFPSSFFNLKHDLQNQLSFHIKQLKKNSTQKQFVYFKDIYSILETPKLNKRRINSYNLTITTLNHNQKQNQKYPATTLTLHSTKPITYTRQKLVRFFS